MPAVRAQSHLSFANHRIGSIPGNRSAPRYTSPPVPALKVTSLSRTTASVSIPPVIAARPVTHRSPSPRAESPLFANHRIGIDPR